MAVAQAFGNYKKDNKLSPWRLSTVTNSYIFRDCPPASHWEYPFNFYHTKRQGVKKIRLRDTTPKPITDKIYHVMFYNDPKSDIQIALALRWKEMKFVNWCPWYKTRNMGWKTFQVAIQSWRQQFRGRTVVCHRGCFTTKAPSKRETGRRALLCWNNYLCILWCCLWWWW